MATKEWRVFNPAGNKRVLVTKELPGERWLEILAKADCRVEICTSPDVVSTDDIKMVMGKQCDAAIGQLTEAWSEDLFATLKAAGGKAYSNYAVGFNNVDVEGATAHGIPVGNTPGVLTETTAQMAVALTFAAARHTGEAERYLRQGMFNGWLPTLFLGKLLWRKTLGIVGAGRIGAAYARMMVEGHKMNLVYYDLYQNKSLEAYISAYNDFLKSQNESPVGCKRMETIEALMQEADCVSIHTVLDDSTHHLINAQRLEMMKTDAILINTSRGPVVDETALVAHCRKHPDFSAGLDVFEDEPALKPGLVELDNVVIVPHIASATSWTREGMAILAAGNVAAMLLGYSAWNQPDIMPFLSDDPPKAAPSILNAQELGIKLFKS